jgi:4-deoxy-L-threo-5-hexosulose-uronate ketol-isomerase
MSREPTSPLAALLLLLVLSVAAFTTAAAAQSQQQQQRVGLSSQTAAPGIATRELPSIDSYAQLGTQQLRDSFLVEKVFSPNEILLTYTTSAMDRLILGGAVPTEGRPLTLDLAAGAASVGSAVLDRRELAVFNIGPGSATVTLDDGERLFLAPKDVAYVPLGTSKVEMAAAAPLESGKSAATTAAAVAAPRLFLASAPCRASYKAAVATPETAKTLKLGAPETANVRALRQMIAPGVGPESCQLMVGVTEMSSGSVLNTMPPHRHLKRSEAYLYFDLPEDQRVFHILGLPQETRHMVVADEQMVLSPPWSVHAGAGTGAYSFVWVMAGENQSFQDMEACPTASLM